MTFPILGMKSASCADTIEASLSQVEGVINARVNFASERARILYVPARSLAPNLLNAVRAAGCDAPTVRSAISFGDIARTPVRLETIVEVRLELRRGRIVIEWLCCNEGDAPPTASLRTLFSILARLIRRPKAPVASPVVLVRSPTVSPAKQVR